MAKTRDFYHPYASNDFIAKSSVKKIRPALTMKFVLTLSDGSLVDVTRSYYTNFRRFFNI